MKQILMIFCKAGIHLNQTYFRDYGRRIKACKTCYTEWDLGPLIRKINYDT